jgi:phosphate transport system substrate-binding protein
MRAATGVKINYQSKGSGAGIKQLQEGIVDFGASDSPMTDDEISNAKHGKVLHFPTVLGAVVVTYNLPDVTTPLRLNGQVIADIFKGTIKKWNDARIAALNPSIKLPATDILVVHRADGSGTTFIFTDYLNSASTTWATTAGGPGKGKEVQWPVGLGGQGNEGVSGQVKQTPGASATPSWRTPSRTSSPSHTSRTRRVSSSSRRLHRSPPPPKASSRHSVLTRTIAFRSRTAQGAGAYPISSMTWLLVYQNPP